MQSRIRAGFALLMLTLAGVAVGAAAGERLKDYVIIGLGTTTDKVLEFDTGSGGSNAKLTAASTGSLTSAGVLLAPSGTAAAPSFGFSTDSNTGAYRVGADNLGFTAGGTLRLDLSTIALTSTVPYLGSAGSASAPSLSFSGDSNTGAYSSAADEFGVATNGTARFLMNAQMQAVSAGTNSAATYTWDGDENTGMYHFANDEIGFTAAGVRQMEMRAGYVRTQVPHAFIDGSAANPGITAENDQDSGVYFPAANQVAIANGGSLNTIFVGSQIQASNGTAGNPAFSYSSNTNTGVFLPSSNVLGFSTAGTVRASVTSGGLQFYEASSGQGEFKVKIFTGTLASSSEATLTNPGTLLLSVSGMTSVNGAAHLSQVIVNNIPDAATCQVGVVNTNVAPSIRIRNCDSDDSNDYRVVMFYQ